MTAAELNTLTGPELLAALQVLTTSEVIPILRQRLRRVIMLLNGKGGAGKTTESANIAVNLANELHRAGSEKRILLIGLDPQGNLNLDVGTRNHPDQDNGQSVVNLVMGVGNVNVIKDVRPNLDLIPDGRQLRFVHGAISGAKQVNPKAEPRLALAMAVAAMAHLYEWIIIDCPPGHPELQDLAAVMAEYLVIPVSFDEGNIDGMSNVADVLVAARDLNPAIQLLGVILFRFDRTNIRSVKEDGQVVGHKEVGQLARVRRDIVGLLAENGLEEAPVFSTVITEAKVIAELCRKFGRVVGEVADHVNDPAWRRAARERGINLSADSAETSAAEQEAITIEVISRALELETARAA